MGAGSSRSALKDKSLRDDIARDFIYNTLPKNKEYMNAITKSYKDLKKEINRNKTPEEKERLKNEINAATTKTPEEKKKLKKEINAQEETWKDRMWRQYETKSAADQERFIVSILDADGKSYLENAVYRARKRRNEESSRRRSLNGKSKWSLPTLPLNNTARKARNMAARNMATRKARNMATEEWRRRRENVGAKNIINKRNATQRLTFLTENVGVLAENVGKQEYAKHLNIARELVTNQAPEGLNGKALNSWIEERMYERLKRGEWGNIDRNNTRKYLMSYKKSLIGSKSEKDRRNAAYDAAHGLKASGYLSPINVANTATPRKGKKSKGITFAKGTKRTRPTPNDDSDDSDDDDDEDDSEDNSNNSDDSEDNSNNSDNSEDNSNNSDDSEDNSNNSNNSNNSDEENEVKKMQNELKRRQNKAKAKAKAKAKRKGKANPADSTNPFNQFNNTAQQGTFPNPFNQFNNAAQQGTFPNPPNTPTLNKTPADKAKARAAARAAAAAKPRPWQIKMAERAAARAAAKRGAQPQVGSIFPNPLANPPPPVPVPPPAPPVTPASPPVPPPPTAAPRPALFSRLWPTTNPMGVTQKTYMPIVPSRKGGKRATKRKQRKRS